MDESMNDAKGIIDARDLEIFDENKNGIANSAIFLSLVTSKYLEDPLTAMQLGIAVAMDKPFFLLVEEGTELPDNLRRLAHGIEYFNREDGVVDSMERLMGPIRDVLQSQKKSEAN